MNLAELDLDTFMNAIVKVNKLMENESTCNNLLNVAKKDIPIISTCQVNPDNNGYTEDNFCVDGTEGQKKISYTLMSNRISFPADGHTEHHTLIAFYWPGSP